MSRRMEDDKVCVVCGHIIDDKSYEFPVIDRYQKQVATDTVCDECMQTYVDKNYSRREY